MGNVVYKYTNEFNEIDIKKLYENAGWTAYTQDITKLMEALRTSLSVVSAWDGEELIGLIRVVGDGATIIYIQDILVLASYQRKGIGSGLLKSVMEKFKNVRQKVLLTDDTEETRGFYEANGFFSCDRGDMVAFVRFN